MAKPRKKKAAVIGHNSNELTEDEQKAIFFSNLQKVLGVLDDMDDLKAEMKDVLKTAKNDLGADGLDDLKFAIKKSRSSQRQDQEKIHFAQAKILAWMGYSTGYQADLFVDRATGLDRIQNDGERAGLLGAKRESGFNPGSDEDLTWQHGYEISQALMRDNLQSAMEKRNAEKLAKANELIKQDRPTDSLDDDDPDFSDPDEGSGEDYAPVAERVEDEDCDEAAPKATAAVH